MFQPQKSSGKLEIHRMIERKPKVSCGPGIRASSHPGSRLSACEVEDRISSAQPLYNHNRLLIPKPFKQTRTHPASLLYTSRLFKCVEDETIAEKKNCVPSLAWWLRKRPATTLGRQPYRGILNSLILPLASYNQRELPPSETGW